jgi:small subunit ribosomal protein S17
MPTQAVRNNFRKKKVGIVLSSKMQKTIVVQTRRKALHPLYGKVIEKAAKFKVHDEKGEAKAGDRVLIQETRPISKDKNWRLVEILARGEGHGKRSRTSTSDVKEVLETKPKAPAAQPTPGVA